ncbi:MULTISPECIES: hypothetical protein [Orbaceae]|uniref:hypothetical protein n=1 Tax=Orbaceae TaxID=1240483 RepID=UPI001C6A794C|nr:MULTISPECIES: hypothetical protein [Orbaceae]MBX4132134.1 hypothetical protein [Frischella sp. Ac48]MCX8579116.1 hypothetical protein [Gilliamella sp. B2717]QYN45105.1 hypothetical protein GYM75_09750 [Gilliamella sp. ESL0441]
MKNKLEQIKLFFKDNLIIKNDNNELRDSLNIEDAEILFNIGLPNSTELDFKFTKEINYLNNKELILDDSESRKIIYSITTKQVYLFFPSNKKKTILNVGLFQFLFSIYYYEFFLNNWKNDKENRSHYFNDFEQKMNKLNNNYQSLDYYWEAIIEELSPI